jgi:hypothetical protein
VPPLAGVEGAEDGEQTRPKSREQDRAALRTAGLTAMWQQVNRQQQRNIVADAGFLDAGTRA